MFFKVLNTFPKVLELHYIAKLFFYAFELSHNKKHKQMSAKELFKLK